MGVAGIGSGTVVAFSLDSSSRSCGSKRHLHSMKLYGHNSFLLHKMHFHFENNNLSEQC